MSRPQFDEPEDRRRLAAGSSDWLDWWRRRGERELRCILMLGWDPVGMADVADGWGEYDDYAAGVAHRLRDAGDEREAIGSVSAYLRHIEGDVIGSRGDSIGLPALAARLVAWHEWSFGRSGRPRFASE